MTTTVQEDFLTSAPGQWFNPDRMHGYQCKDTVDAYCMVIFGLPWTETVRPGNGNQVFHNANPAYFHKVANDPNNPKQLPPRGAILSYAGSKAVPEGHTALVLMADENGVDVLQQDGYRQVATHVARLGYEGLIGWLVPRLAADAYSRVVSNDVAYVRTEPHAGAPLAPEYPEGIAKGATLAVTGYIAGHDPYETGDDAWYVTKSGYFVWANAAGNSIAGLPRV